MRKLLVLCAVMLGQPAWAAGSASDPRAVIDAYARRFDNAYMTASRDRPAPSGAPYDAAAADAAQQAHDMAVDACIDRQSEFATHRAWMECFLAADSAYAASVHLSDSLLLTHFLAAVRQAGDDSDAGRLAGGQLANVYFALAETYVAIIHDQDAAWHKAHTSR